MSVDLVFETHSLTVDNERGIATGWLDGRLSDLGRRLARELGERRRDQGLAAVFTSDLGRATETAEIAFGASPLDVLSDSRLRECNYGELNGMPVSQLRSEGADHVARPWPNGESYAQVAQRVAQFLTELSAGWQGERVLIIGHAATRWALDHVLGGTPLDELVSAPFQWRKGWFYRVD